MCAVSMLPSGWKSPDCLSIGCVEMVSSITWCATWLELFSKWVEEIWQRQKFRPSSPLAPATEPGPRLRREGCSWSTWITELLTAKENATLRVWYVGRHYPLSFFPH